MFSCSQFKVTGLRLKSYIKIYSEFICVQCGSEGSSFSLLHVDIQFSQKHWLKWLSSPMYVFSTFFKDLISLFLGPLLYSILLCVCFCASCMLFCYHISVVFFEVRCYTFTIPLFAQDCFCYYGPLLLQYVFLNYSS
jgi:hypothetical protein